MATYAKGLARRASLTKGSARAAKSYKAKVASLTSERAGLQAQIRELTEELVKHKFDLKHATEGREGPRRRAAVGQRGVAGRQG